MSNETLEHQFLKELDCQDAVRRRDAMLVMADWLDERGFELEARAWRKASAHVPLVLQPVSSDYFWNYGFHHSRSPRMKDAENAYVPHGAWLKMRRKKSCPPEASEYDGKYYPTLRRAYEELARAFMLFEKGEGEDVD
jgi:hypothetical protein